MKWLSSISALALNKVKKPSPDVEALYIERVLTTLRDQQQSINIQFYRCQTPFVCTVLYIDPAREFILLDEMNHNEGDHLAINAESFAVKAQCGEDIVIFEGQVSRIQTLRGLRCYRVAYPKVIAHSKRRGCPRYVLPENKKADLLVTHFPHIKTMIKDISMVGVSIAIPKHLRNVLHSLLEANECRLVLHNAPGMSFALGLKNFRNDFDGQQLILGCQFLNLDNIKLKMLAQLLAQAK